MKKAVAILLLLCCSVRAQGIPIAEQARKILKDNCHECHGTKRESDPNFDVTDWRYLTSQRTKLITNNPDTSRIIQRVSSKPPEMPPETRKPLSQEEIDVLKQWIKEGAKTWDKEDREIIDETHITGLIGKDYNKLGDEARNFRYISLFNLYNDGVSDSDLQLARDAISKTMNLLSLNKKLTPTQPLGKLGLAIRVDLRDYGWKASDWDKLVQICPNPERDNFLRADWFIANASIPPFYYEQLKVPKTEKEFEDKLGIPKGSTIRRAGIHISEIALHERLAFRFETKDGVYWKTLNKKDGNDSKVLDHKKFEADYSLGLYSLPNSLFGFVAFQRDENKKGVFNLTDKIDIDAEFDPTQVSGSPHSIPMLSCVTCHTYGLQPNIRDVTGGTAVDFLQQDKIPFVRAVQKVSRSIEPIRSVAERYNRPVDLNTAANDLGLDREDLTKIIKIQKIVDLIPLTEDKTVTRRIWQDVHARRLTKLLRGEIR